MTEFPAPAGRASIGNVLLWTLLLPVGLFALGVLVVVPLPWKEQGIMGVALMALALLLNLSSSAATVTMTLIAISVFSTLRYGYWRVIQTWEGMTSAGHLHQWDTFFVLLLLSAELYAFATLVLGYFQTLRPLKRRPVPLVGNPQSWPMVDVFIPTYNEPLSVVRATVLGALALDYPENKMKVFLLDDGRRREFSDFAAAVGVIYITRSDNAHAKAGNINHALGRTSGEFVAIFDSDHVPTRSFLQATLGWFMRDHRLGMVQTPHHFYSPDPFERNLGQFRKIPNEGELFHRLVQDGNDLWNASFFCGSCAVLRRRALNEIRGIAVETVTEDAHTALRMQKRRWNTAYINIPQAAGLATESLAAHIGQRIRWARGMVQILRTENPLLVRGLSFPQRLCYFNATTHFLFALPRLLFRHRFSFWNEIYEAVLAPYILFPTLLALINPRLGKFNVTSKGGIVRRSYFDRRIAWPFLLLLALNVAGLVMAERRFVSDPAHHDTVIMNAVWTVYNIVILSVAASVAWERRQRRSQVRVNVRTPITVVANGERIVGVASQLSCRGATARLARSVKFARGTAVMLAFEGNGSRFEIPARVMHSAKRHQHLCFPQLSLAQEKYLVNLVYSRPEAWLSWQDSRAIDNPLRSLAHIVWLSLRGACIVSLGIFTRRPLPDRDSARLQRSKERSPAVAACLLLCALVALPARGAATPDATAADPANAATTQNVVPQPASQPAAFHDQYELAELGGQKTIVLTGAGASQNFFLDMPLTKIISSAALDLHYAAPMLSPGESWLELWLNGTRVGSIPLQPGSDARANVSLPTDLLTTNNTVTIQLQGACAACTRKRAPWVTINPTSELKLSGTRLPLANDLALLPIPFFDSAGQHSWSLPVVFADRPGTNALEAASIVASWFGIFSDFRGVRFPVTVGELGEGNAVIFTLRDSELAKSLSLPSRPGPLIAIRENPRDPYGKLLIVAGDRTEDLLTAARALVIRNNAQAHADSASVSEINLPVRHEYGAPRWLRSDRPAPIGMYTTEERLKVKGAGSVNLYFRIPPDLFLQAQQSVPLLLKFGYAGVAEGSHAALHVRLNDQNVDSIRLDPASSSVERAEIVRLPTGRFRPYTNTLTVDFDFGRSSAPTNVWRYAAIHRDSSLDLSGLPHSVVLPRLELFADSGYPFTAWPDLGRAAIVLSNAPTAAEYETLLDMTAFFGGQTGSPATAITITDPAHIDSVRDKDLVLLGTSASQPLLTEWAGNMPLDFSSGEMRLNNREEPSRLLHPEWPFRGADREKLTNLLAKAEPLDVAIADFVSPFRADRSVVSIVHLGPKSPDAIAAMFTPAAEKGPIYGGLALAQNGRFQSFLVGTFAYHSGHLDPVQQTRIFLFENYFLIPFFVSLLALMVAAWLHQSTERIAARRLAAERT